MDRLLALNFSKDPIKRLGGFVYPQGIRYTSMCISRFTDIENSETLSGTQRPMRNPWENWEILENPMRDP